MRLIDRSNLAIAVVASVLAGVVVATGFDSPHAEPGGLLGIFYAIVGVAWVLGGLIARVRRPGNSAGALMIAVGLAWLLRGFELSGDPWLFAFGAILVSLLFFGPFVQLLMTFPDGYARGGVERLAIAAAWAAALITPLGVFFVQPQKEFACADCPENPLAIVDLGSFGSALAHLPELLGAVAATLAIVALVRAYRAAAPPRRRALMPVLVGGIGCFACFVLVVLIDAVYEPAAIVAFVGALIFFAAVPFGFVLGLVRARMVRSTALGSLVAGLAAPGQIRDALAAALRDPSLELAFWVPERSRYVTAEGHDVALPEDDPMRAVTPVERGGERVAAIIHHPSLAEDPVLLRAAAAAAGLGLERERLEAELRARIVQLRASRTALVDAGDRERRRLERNLHDGAQQRLVALSLTLRLARGASASNPESAATLLAAAGQELQLALGELDELAKGINPAALAENGLVQALDDLARRFPVPVELDIADRVPLGEGVRDAAYFVVSEALANVAKYAGASRVIVRVDSAGESLVVEVDDDGVGGADPAAGSGLRGLAGRVEALDGRLDVVSPPGRGTTIRAEMPCAS